VIAAHLRARSREGILALEVKGTMARLIHIAAFAGLAALSAAGGAVATIGLVAPDLLRARLSPAPAPVAVLAPAPDAPAQAALPAPFPHENSAQKETIAETGTKPFAKPFAKPLEPLADPVPEASPPAPDRPGPETAAQEAVAQEIAAQPPSPPDLAVFGALRHPRVEPAPAPRMASLAAPLASFSPAATPLETLALSFARAPIPEDALPPPTGPDALDGPEDLTASDHAAPRTSEHASLIRSQGLEPRRQESQRPPPTGPVVVIDASEGTTLDPLRQKNWDLNAVQVIPALKPETR